MGKAASILAVLAGCTATWAQSGGGTKRPDPAAAGETADAPPRTAPTDALNRIVPALALDEVPLEAVLAQLAEQAGVTINVDWGSLDAAQVARDTPISLRTRALPLKTVLWIVLRQATLDQSLAYAVGGDLVVIASTTSFDRDLITRAYDVNDLVTHFRFQIPDPKYWVEPVLGLRQAAGRCGANRACADGGGNLAMPRGAPAYSNWPSEQREQHMKELVRCITDTVEPEHWQVNGGRGRMSWFEGTLVVYASPRIHQMIGGPLTDAAAGVPAVRTGPTRPTTKFPVPPQDNPPK